MNAPRDWTDQAKALLDESAQNLDAATLSRLNRVRQAALAQRVVRPLRTWYLPASLASACMLLIAVTMWQGRPHRQMPLQPAAAVNASDDDATADDDAFLEDLDFYAWLDAQDDEG